MKQDGAQPALALVEGQGEKDALLLQQCSLHPGVQGVVSCGGQPGWLEAEAEEIGLGSVGEAQLRQGAQALVGQVGQATGFLDQLSVAAPPQVLEREPELEDVAVGVPCRPISPRLGGASGSSSSGCWPM